MPSVLGLNVHANSARAFLWAGLLLLAVIASAAVPLDISNGDVMPDARTGQFYSYQFRALGGKPPYRWSADFLPPGMTLEAKSGVFSGVPASVGEWDFVITVTDSARVRASQTFSAMR